jgi:hypothetical protein
VTGRDLKTLAATVRKRGRPWIYGQWAPMSCTDPERGDSDISQGQVNSAELPLEENVCDEQRQDCISSNSSVRVVAPGGGVPGMDFLEATSSLTTQSMSRAAELRTSKAKRSKSSPPLSITQEGSYYRAIIVYVDRQIT